MDSIRTVDHITNVVGISLLIKIKPKQLGIQLWV
jgi:hypothetical protein